MTPYKLTPQQNGGINPKKIDEALLKWANPAKPSKNQLPCLNCLRLNG